MSIGGNPSVAGSITLDDTVEHVKWKSSANATAQDVNTIRLDGQTIWNKPDLQIEITNAAYDTGTEDVTLSVSKPALIDTWKYQLNGGNLSSAQTGSAVTIGDLSNGTYNITVRGYRGGVEKSADIGSVVVNQDNAFAVSVIWNVESEEASLIATLGSSITKWSYENVTDGGGENFVLSGTTATIDTTNLTEGNKSLRFKAYVESTFKTSRTQGITIVRPTISVNAESQEPLKIALTLAITNANNLTHRWFYKIGSGNLQGPFSPTTTTKTMDASAGAQLVSVYLKASSDENSTTLAQDSDSVTVNANADIVGSATYTPLSKKVTYSVNIGAGVTKWSYQAINYTSYLVKNGDLQGFYDNSSNSWDYNQDGSPEPVQSKSAEEFAESHWTLVGQSEGRAGPETTGETFVTSGTSAISDELGVAQDGIWNVTFKSYINSTHFETDNRTVTVATPFVEITSVEELTPSAPEAPIAVGDIVGMGVWGVEVWSFGSDIDEDFFRYVVLDGIFDSVNWPADGNNGEREGRASKTFQGLIDDYGVWTPGADNQASGYSGVQKSTLDAIINAIPTTSTAYAWQMFDLADSSNWESQVRSGQFDDHSEAVGFQFTATIGETTYTLGVTKASVYWGVNNGQASPYISPAENANSFWQENAYGLGSPIDNFDIYEIEVIS